MHVQLLSGFRRFNFGPNLYLHSFYVCASSEGHGDAASKGRHVLEMTDQIFNKYQKSHELAHFFPKQPLLMKFSGSSLISDQKKIITLIFFNGNL